MARYRDIAIILLCLVLAVCAYTLTQSCERLLLAVTETTDSIKSSQQQVVMQMAPIAPQVTQTLSQVGKATDSLNKLLEATNHRMNDLCDPGPCGVLSDVAKTLATSRGTMGQVEEASIQFNRHSSTFYDQEAASATTFEKTMGDVDNFVTSTDLLDTLHNANTASLAVSGSAQNVDAVTTDGRTWIHQKLFPTKKRGIVTGIEATGDVVHHWLPPLF